MNECGVCGYPGLRRGGHAEWCERTRAWLASIPVPGVLGGMATAAKYLSQSAAVDPSPSVTTASTLSHIVYDT